MKEPEEATWQEIIRDLTSGRASRMHRPLIVQNQQARRGKRPGREEPLEPNFVVLSGEDCRTLVVLYSTDILSA